MSADNTLDQAEPTTAIHDPGQAWFLARYQVLRDIAHDVTLLGQGAAARGKTPTEMADRIVAVLGDLAQREWEGYAHHVGRRSASLTDSLLQAAPPIRVYMHPYPAEDVDLPTAAWEAVPVEVSGTLYWKGDGKDEGFSIPPLMPLSPAPEAGEDLVVIELVDRRHIATAMMNELMARFAKTALVVMAPCDPAGAWRRLRVLSQFYREEFVLARKALSADELQQWDKSALDEISLADAARIIGERAFTALAIRVLSLGALTSALTNWILSMDGRRPDPGTPSPQSVVLDNVLAWSKSYEKALASFNDAILLERSLLPSSWDIEVIQRPFPGQLPIAVATRKR
ncbi:hypothetical protein ABQW72_00305 [Xanthomonas hortorum pv. pelargonii]|uniref:hypothetical protein n=1 Tax=Xanthomonas hortorum TaxID=56454 RepID=UPI0021C98159|nr:hypothetical protein [Xanthomonas hortorum]MCU1709534.1 hypothetical protein [Xanthomonas hortorum pv. pelargonii]WCI07290.1 hypothetical protein PML25_22085 [Xanthomonas hortorum pv. pelargonii]WOB32975.1 hypothetical protein NYR98_22620 [Xanthomonas hortorum pv. pelargonii]